jgi:hypothetical protein
MHTTTVHCDACGQKIEGARTRCRIKDPTRVQSWWSMLGHWVEMDICPECFKGLQAVAAAIVLANRARGI